MKNINEKDYVTENNSQTQEKDKIEVILSEREQMELFAEIITEIYLKIKNGKSK